MKSRLESFLEIVTILRTSYGLSIQDASWWIKDIEIIQGVTPLDMIVNGNSDMLIEALMVAPINGKVL